MSDIEHPQDHAMTTTHLLTAAELAAMGSDARFELVKGVLVEHPLSGFEASVIGANFTFKLYTFVREHDLGVVLMANCGFVVEVDPDTVIAPDGAFVRSDRIPPSIPPHGYFPEAPDLAVEVNSFLDTPADIRRKQALYDRIGVPLVWWIDPDHRTATVHAPGRPVRHLTELDLLDGESVVPGFSLPLASLFQF